MTYNQTKSIYKQPGKCNDKPVASAETVDWGFFFLLFFFVSSCIFLKNLFFKKGMDDVALNEQSKYKKEHLSQGLS